MEKISNSTDLKAAIAKLELQRTEEGQIVKQQFMRIQDDLRPANLLKNAFKDLVTSPELKYGVIDVSIGVAAGSLAKKAIIGDSQNSMRELLASAAESFVTKEVTKNAERIRSWGHTLLEKFIGSK